MRVMIEMPIPKETHTDHTPKSQIRNPQSAIRNPDMVEVASTWL
jgi:hypothetical protein